ELDRAWQRGVVARDEEDTLGPADFHTRFDYWAMFEGWKDVPENIRDCLNSWELQHYFSAHSQDLETIRSGRIPSPERFIPRYLLLKESLEVIDRVEHIYLWPCNCRLMLGNCSKPVHTCLRFFNDRDIGWEISPEKAKEVIQEANQAGLMQCGEFGLTKKGGLSGGICNCCADCCFPHLMAREFEAAKIWPRSRYLARQHQDLCLGCGRCVRRCPFQALTRDNTGKAKKGPPDFNPDLCRGCGLCATGCPEQAIEMVALPGAY
ncbi:MAG: 4Fe-4S binding protein, partial [Thermodesulfobacteriota bacterium]